MAATTVPAFDIDYDVVEADLANRALARIGSEAILDTEEDTEVARLARRYFAATRDEMLRLYQFRFSIAYALIPEVELARKNGYEYAYEIPDTLLSLRILEVGEREEVEGYERVGNYLLSNDYSRDEKSFVASTTTGSDELTECEEDLGLDEGDYLVGDGIPDGTTFSSQDGSVVTMSAAATATAADITVTAPRLLHIEYVKQILDPGAWDPLFQDAFVLRLASRLALTLVGKYDLVQAIQAEYAVIIDQARVASSAEREFAEGEEPWTTRQ